jgi:adhesin transport system membrane fusion protein
MDRNVTRRRGRLERTAQGEPEDAAFAVGRAGADVLRPRRSAHLLLMVIVAFFAIALAWASHASLDEVTRGQGRVIPSSQVQVVQNLEGGIVANILVHEGEVVERGQVLLRIDDIAAASSFRERRERLRALRGAMVRLQAEVEGRDISFDEGLAREAEAFVRNETALFDARRRALGSELEVLESQVDQRRQELLELEHRTRQLQRSLDLAKEELAITEPLAARRVVSKVDLLRLKRQVNDLEGELESARLTLPRVRAALREAERRIVERQDSFVAEAQRELNTVQAEATALAESLAADADRVERTDVRSPVRGTIKQLLVRTVGGVVQPGQDLVEVVPLEDTLLVEAQVRPADIAFIHPGQPAVVKVTAYDFSVYGGLDGVVEDISADTITDDAGEDFYRIRIRTTENALEGSSDDLPIIPGMTTQVDILTGKKTVLDYLLKPIVDAGDRALNER